MAEEADACPVKLAAVIVLAPAVMLLLTVSNPVKVVAPVTPNVLESVVAPVTPNVLESVVAPVTPNVLESVLLR
jgi:hypothetical protein